MKSEIPASRAGCQPALQSESYRKQHTVRIWQHYDSGSISAAEPEECRAFARLRGREAPQRVGWVERHETHQDRFLLHEMMGFTALHPSYPLHLNSAGRQGEKITSWDRQSALHFSPMLRAEERGMQYRRISADCHLDLPWLPAELFVSEAQRELRDRMPYVVDGPDGPRWTTKP